LADKVYILVHFVGLDLMEDDRMDVLAAGKDLREGALDIPVELLAFLGTVDEGREGATLGRLAGGFGLLFFSYNAVGGK